MNATVEALAEEATSHHGRIRNSSDKQVPARKLTLISKHKTLDNVAIHANVNVGLVDDHADNVLLSVIHFQLHHARGGRHVAIPEIEVNTKIPSVN